MNLRKFTSLLVFGAIAALLMVGGFSLLRDYREYRQFKRAENAASRRLAEIERHLAEQTRIGERLQKDREFVELMIRRRLNYAKPEEQVFRFEEK